MDKKTTELLNENRDSIYTLSKNGLNKEERQAALRHLYHYETTQKRHFLGYQLNNKMDYETDLSTYLNYHINNVGDPFQNGNLTMNSKEIECAVLDYYGELWHAETPHDKNNPESYWGYVLSMGATEGNFYALWNARDYLSGKFLLVDEDAEKKAKAYSELGAQVIVKDQLIYYEQDTPEHRPNAYKPIAFFSQDTHYSIVKSVRILDMDTFHSMGSGRYTCPLKYPEDYPENFSKQYLDENDWPLEVPSNMDGTIHIPSLVKLAEFFISKGFPIYVCFNYGTTFKGAYDRVDDAIGQLIPILKKYGMYERKVYYDKKNPKKYDIRNGFWFHVDGALGTAYMPFIEKAIHEGRIDVPPHYEFPICDFRINELQSLVMSGHKWIGAPFPCGIFMTKIKYQLLPPDDPMYIGSPDTTFAGSRNGLAPMVLWDYLAKLSYEDQIAMAVETEELARYTQQALEEVEDILGQDLWVERSPFSLTIRFKRPSESLIFKYSLSCETLYVGGKKREYVHLFVMNHVTKELIDDFIRELVNDKTLNEVAVS